VIGVQSVAKKSRTQQYQQFSEILELDLDENAIADLRQARHDRATKNQDAYVDLDAIQ